jgi:hypothetical protein
VERVIFKPVTDKSGVILLDIFIDGKWMGSRRAYTQCVKYVEKLLKDKMVKASE